jgi:hypothetical protein
MHYKLLCASLFVVQGHVWMQIPLTIQTYTKSSRNAPSGWFLIFRRYNKQLGRSVSFRIFCINGKGSRMKVQ